MNKVKLPLHTSPRYRSIHLMMSIPRTVSSNISICKRMKVCHKHPFTFPPHLVALKRHLLFSLVSNCMPNSLSKETCTNTTSPLSQKPRVEPDGHCRQVEEGGCRRTAGLLVSQPFNQAPCPPSSQFPGIFCSTEQETITAGVY